MTKYKFLSTGMCDTSLKRSQREEQICQKNPQSEFNFKASKVEITEKVHNIGKFGYKLNIILSFIFSSYLKHDSFKTKNMQQGISKDMTNYYNL